jgi:hypothetical protein
MKRFGLTLVVRQIPPHAAGILATLLMLSPGLAMAADAPYYIGSERVETGRAFSVVEFDDVIIGTTLLPSLTKAMGKPAHRSYLPSGTLVVWEHDVTRYVFEAGDASHVAQEATALAGGILTSALQNSIRLDALRNKRLFVVGVQAKRFEVVLGKNGEGVLTVQRWGFSESTDLETVSFDHVWWEQHREAPGALLRHSGEESEAERRARLEAELTSAGVDDPAVRERMIDAAMKRETQ